MTSSLREVIGFGERLLFLFSIFSFLWPFLLCLHYSNLILTKSILSAEILIGNRGTGMWRRKEKGEEPTPAYLPSSSMCTFELLTTTKSVSRELTSWHTECSQQNLVYMNKDYLNQNQIYWNNIASWITRRSRHIYTKSIILLSILYSPRSYKTCPTKCNAPSLDSLC